MPSLQSYLSSGRLRRLPGSAREIADLLRVVDRDLLDARIDTLSADRRFATAYNAALQLCTVVLRAEGLRTAGVGHHHTTILCLPEIMGEDSRPTSDYLDACRSKRNTVDYDGVGVASEAEARELIEEVGLLRQSVMAWLTSEHPELSPS